MTDLTHQTRFLTGLKRRYLGRRKAMRAARQGGFVVVLVAVAILPLLALTGLVIDVGRARLVHDQLDGAVQAGIITATKTYNGADIPATQARLESMVNLNFPAGKFGTDGAPTVDNFTVESSSPLELRVEAEATVNALFMGIINWRASRQEFLDVRVAAQARRVNAVPPYDYILVQ
ncbi:MAG: hypothetical protein Alpg2KO_03790 [Alphaproteobacteria bacterium]